MTTTMICLAAIAALAAAGYLAGCAGAGRWLTPREWLGWPCKHDYQFLHNLYGDQIIAYGWKRSLWKCSKCRKVTARDALHDC